MIIATTRSCLVEKRLYKNKIKNVTLAFHVVSVFLKLVARLNAYSLAVRLAGFERIIDVACKKKKKIQKKKATQC